MRKAAWKIRVAVLFGLCVLLAASLALAQWGAIQSGVDAARRAAEAEKQPQQQSQPTKAYEGSARPDDKVTGVSTAPVTYQCKIRSFSYTIPAGWRLERGNPAGSADERQDIIFMKPGTTCGFSIQWHQYVPAFPGRPMWTPLISRPWKRRPSESTSR